MQTLGLENQDTMLMTSEMQLQPIADNILLRVIHFVVAVLVAVQLILLLWTPQHVPLPDPLVPHPSNIDLQAASLFR